MCVWSWDLLWNSFIWNFNDCNCTTKHLYICVCATLTSNIIYECLCVCVYARLYLFVCFAALGWETNTEKEWLKVHKIHTTCNTSTCCMVWQCQHIQHNKCNNNNNTHTCYNNNNNRRTHFKHHTGGAESDFWVPSVVVVVLWRQQWLASCLLTVRAHISVVGGRWWRKGA